MARALGAVGAEASAAEPVLRGLRDGADARTREAIDDALRRITGR